MLEKERYEKASAVVMRFQHMRRSLSDNTLSRLDEALTRSIAEDDPEILTWQMVFLIHFGEFNASRQTREQIGYLLDAWYQLNFDKHGNLLLGDITNSND